MMMMMDEDDRHRISTRWFPRAASIDDVFGHGRSGNGHVTTSSSHSSPVTADEILEVEDEEPNQSKRRKSRGSKKNKSSKKRNKKRNKLHGGSGSGEIQVLPTVLELGCSGNMKIENDSRFYQERSETDTVFESADGDSGSVVESGIMQERESSVSSAKLRQRNVNGSGRGRDEFVEENGFSNNSTRDNRESLMGLWMPDANHEKKLEKDLSLDWGKVMDEHRVNLGGVMSAEMSPSRYFMGEIYGGNTMRNTISVGNEKERQKVYNTMFHVPLKCERLIFAGFFVCLDSFLSLLTVVPLRILISLWSIFNGQFHWPDAAEVSDFGCFTVLVAGVIILQLTDISLIYHIIRGQGVIKLYVVYNVLEIFDKLLQSLGVDILQVLFNSAEVVTSSDSTLFVLLRCFMDLVIATVVFILHSFILLAQAITLSTCIIAHNNALMALLVSNNFAEIKSNVFKKFSKDNLHNVIFYDIIEIFHITTFILFVLAQNVLEAEGSWFGNFINNAILVYACELIIDTIKHAFLANFNDIKPDAYSDFLEDLCKQVLNAQPDDNRKNLKFIPLAPACVVIKTLTPIYATLLPYGPLPWRWFWIIFWSTLTFLILAISKILVGVTLNQLAAWYIKQRSESKQHVD